MQYRAVSGGEDGGMSHYHYHFSLQSTEYEEHSKQIAICNKLVH